jgi:alpha-mannosidase
VTRLFKTILAVCIIGAFAGVSRAQDLSSDTLYLVGQSHIDIAWKWQWPETIVVCRDTFGQALQLMQDYPDFRYSQSQAVLYAAMEQNYPDLFAGMKQAVKEGKWDIVGGMWVEPDANMPSGEALVRQCLYGQRYFRTTFGRQARFGWLPDTFGLPPTLPQILKKSGMSSLFFAKLVKGPGALYTWEAPDGSQVTMFDARAEEAAFDRAGGRLEDLSSIPKALAAVFKLFPGKAVVIPYGVGDHGGGPTRRDITMFKMLGQLPGMPKIKLATGDEGMAAMMEGVRALPVWGGELNYYGDGCYTSQAKMKQHNRRCETLLPNAEKFGVMAMTTGGFDYPRAALATAWRGALFNQFHDILPGSGIGPVYEDATELYRQVEAAGQTALDNALAALADRANTQGKGDAVVVFNPMPWARTDLAQVTLDYPNVPANLTVRDSSGNQWPAQVAEHHRIYESFERCQVILAARDVPPLGFKVFWIERADSAPATGLSAGDYWVEGPRFRIEVDGKTGHVTSIRDKKLGREVLAAGAQANVLRLLADEGDAWEIHYSGGVAELDQPTSVKVIERGPVRATIEVTYLRNGSVYNQRISIYDDIERVDFPTTVDWREYHTTLKARFPLAFKAATFDREIPFGNIAHDCNGDEVPAQKWIDVSDADWGVSLLNDCKYGHSVNGNEMTITLLRSPTSPDPAADLGHQTMTYSLYPHAKGWRQALTQRRAEDLNAPLMARAAKAHDGVLGTQHTMLEVQPDNVLLAAAKPCEDSGDLLIRIWEAHGQPATARIKLPVAPAAAKEVDMLEDEVGPAQVEGGQLVVNIKPYEVRSFKVQLQGAKAAAPGGA